MRRHDPTFDRVDIQQKLMLHRAKIDLLMNPQKTEYGALQAFVDEAMRHAGDSLAADKPNVSALATDRDKIVSAAQLIFRKQWERVKNLE